MGDCQNGRAAILCPDEGVRSYNFISQMRQPAVVREIAMLRQLWAAHCEVGLARYAGSIPQQFDFRPNRKGFNTPNVLKHSLENREAVECISEFAMLLRVCDRQSP